MAQLANLARLDFAQATILGAALEARLAARLGARRQHQPDPLGRRERADFVRREWWWLGLLL